MKEYIQKYLDRIGVPSIEELTDEQVEHFFAKEYEGTPICWGYYTSRSALRDGAFTKSQIINSMRKALRNEQLFECGYIIGESAFGHFPLEEVGWVLKPKPDPEA